MERRRRRENKGMLSPPSHKRVKLTSSPKARSQQLVSPSPSSTKSNPANPGTSSQLPNASTSKPLSAPTPLTTTTAEAEAEGGQCSPSPAKKRRFSSFSVEVPIKNWSSRNNNKSRESGTIEMEASSSPPVASTSRLSSPSKPSSSTPKFTFSIEVPTRSPPKPLSKPLPLLPPLTTRAMTPPPLSIEDYPQFTLIDREPSLPPQLSSYVLNPDFEPALLVGGWIPPNQGRRGRGLLRSSDAGSRSGSHSRGGTAEVELSEMETEREDSVAPSIGGDEDLTRRKSGRTIVKASLPCEIPRLAPRHARPLRASPSPSSSPPPVSHNRRSQIPDYWSFINTKPRSDPPLKQVPFDEFSDEVSEMIGCLPVGKMGQAPLVRDLIRFRGKVPEVCGNFVYEWEALGLEEGAKDAVMRPRKGWAWGRSHWVERYREEVVSEDEEDEPEEEQVEVSVITNTLPLPLQPVPPSHSFNLNPFPFPPLASSLSLPVASTSSTPLVYLPNFPIPQPLPFPSSSNEPVLYPFGRQKLSYTPTTLPTPVEQVSQPQVSQTQPPTSTSTSTPRPIIPIHHLPTPTSSRSSSPSDSDVNVGGRASCLPISFITEADDDGVVVEREVKWKGKDKEVYEDNEDEEEEVKEQVELQEQGIGRRESTDPINDEEVVFDDDEEGKELWAYMNA